MKNTKEIVKGLSGSGHTVWHVVTVRPDGSWLHRENFDTKAEAMNWLKWA